MRAYSRYLAVNIVYSPEIARIMAESSPTRGSYNWQDCEDFHIPENSVWLGNDDSGSDIFCGKAWCDGQEFPAKVIPERRECIITCGEGEKVVPNCRKVLICDGPRRNHCSPARSHCHRRRRSCRRTEDDCCSSSGSDNEECSSQTKTTSHSKNECRVFLKSMKSSSDTTTISVKKNKKKHHHKRCHDERSCQQQCWDEQRTRIVPKVTYEPRVRYEPKVTMERRVRYQPESYVTRVCAERCCDSYEDCCEPCEPCGPERRCSPERRCREAVICDRSAKPCEVEKEERCVRPERCDSPPPKGKCW